MKKVFYMKKNLINYFWFFFLEIDMVHFDSKLFVSSVLILQDNFLAIKQQFTQLN